MFQGIPTVEERESSPSPTSVKSPLSYLSPTGLGGGGGPVAPRGNRPKRHEKRSSSSQRLEGLRRSNSNLTTTIATSQQQATSTTSPPSASLSSPTTTVSPFDATTGKNRNQQQQQLQPSSPAVEGLSSSSSVATNNNNKQLPITTYPHPSSSSLLSNHNNNTFEIGMKVVVLGQGNCGKSSLITKLVHGTFARVRSPSIGVDFQSRSFELEFPGLARLKRQYSSKSGSQQPPQILLKMNLWDIAGQEDCGIGTSTYYQGAKAAIIVYDVTNPTSLAKALAWKRDLDRKASFDENGIFRIPAILVGNKADLVAYPLPLGDSQTAYQRSRRSSVAKNSRTNTASRINNRNSAATADLSLRGSYASTGGGGGARGSTVQRGGSFYSEGSAGGAVYRSTRSTNGEEDEEDEYNDNGLGDEGDDDDLRRSSSNNNRYTIKHRNRSSSRIIDAEAAALALLQVESMDNSPNGFINIAVVPTNTNHDGAVHHVVDTSLHRNNSVAEGANTNIPDGGSRIHSGGRGGGREGSRRSPSSDGQPTTPRTNLLSGSDGIGRTVSDSRGFLTPTPFNASRGDDLDAMMPGGGVEDFGGGGVDTERFLGSDRDLNVSESGNNGVRARTPKRMPYENRSRRGSTTSIGTPGLRSPTTSALNISSGGGGGAVRSSNGFFSGRSLDAPTVRRMASSSPSQEDALIIPDGGGTITTPASNNTSLPRGDVSVDKDFADLQSAMVISSPLNYGSTRSEESAGPQCTVVDVADAETTGTMTAANTSAARSNPNISTVTSKGLAPEIPPATALSATTATSINGGGGNAATLTQQHGRSSGSSVALNLRRSHHQHQLQQAASFLQHQQESRMIMPETKQQIEDFINEHRFVGHFFSSARSGLCVDEIAEYTLHSILKMDPHGTDDIEAYLRGEAAARGSSSSLRSGARGGIGGVGGSGRITKANMSAAPTRRGKKNRQQQTRFGGCVVQ